MGCRGRAGTCSSLAVFLCLAMGWQNAAAAQAAIAQPDYSIYLKKDQLLEKVQELAAAHPDTMKMEMRHAKDGDYSADLLVVTVEPAGISPTHTSKARLLLDFGEHGREYITSEVALRLLQVLQDDKQLEKLLGSSKRLQRLKAILQHIVIKVLPMENVHGRELVEAGQLCERKNGRGVDPNRNWDIDWGKKEKDYDPNEEFPGRAPLSEPEVQILLALAKELKPHLWLNVHSGMYALFTPYDHKPYVPNGTNAQAAIRMMQRIKDLSCPRCVVGSGGHSVGYLAHGTGTDYMFEVLGVPMSFTWEIYGDSTAAFEDCFKMFNPLGKEHFEEVVTLWTKALLQLLELLPSHPSTWPVFKHAGLDKLGGTDAYVTGGHAHGNNQAAAAAAAALGTSEDSTTQQQQQGVVSGGLTGSKNDDDGGGGGDDDGDAQPEQEGSLWRQPEVEDDITTDTDHPPASPSVVDAGISTTQQVASVQPEQLIQQQIQQQQQQPGQHASTALKDMQQEVGLQVIGGNSSSKPPSLLHGSKVLPLLVGMGGLAALALYLARNMKSQPPGPVYNRVVVRSRMV